MPKQKIIWHWKRRTKKYINNSLLLLSITLCFHFVSVYVFPCRASIRFGVVPPFTGLRDKHTHIALPDNTLHSQETDTHAPGGHRTRRTMSYTARPLGSPHSTLTRIFMRTNEIESIRRTFVVTLEDMLCFDSTTSTCLIRQYELNHTRHPLASTTMGLTPCITVLLENVTDPQFKKLSDLFRTRRFIAAFTAARHLSLFWARSIQSTHFHLIFEDRF